MKINKAKMMVSTLAIIAGAATVGSISGTVAWFQYNTRVTAAYQGAAAHSTENVEIRIRSTQTTGFGAWSHDLTTSMISAYLSAASTDGVGAGRTTAGNKLTPVTTGELAEYAFPTDLYKNPMYQEATTTKWGVASATEDYIDIPLEIRVLDVDGAASASYLEKNVYISDLTIEAHSDNGTHTDVSSAIRVGVKAGLADAEKVNYATFSKDGEAVDVYGKLDLNGDGANDQNGKYEWDTRTDIVYGEDGKQAKSTIATQLASTATATDVGVANDDDMNAIKGKPIGTTASDKNLEVDLRIYLEGWQQLGTGKALWDASKTVGATFHVGIRFTADAHNIH